MAFFGLTHTGYQNPVGDQMLANHRGESVPHVSRIGGVPPSSQEPQESLRRADASNRSHEHLRRTVKLCQTVRSPKQLYRMALTENQEYGWVATESLKPWTKGKRFPRRMSEMTKFVNEMSVKHRDFSLF